MLPSASSTLSNWCSIVSQYELHERLHALSFSHYAETAYVEKSERESLLAWAVEHQASVSQLRAEKNSRGAVQDAPILNEAIPQVETQEFSSDEISGIFAGNLKPLIRLFSQWRGKVQNGKRYKLMLVEIE
jgi:hypothetical protein